MILRIYLLQLYMLRNDWCRTYSEDTCCWSLDITWDNKAGPVLRVTNCAAVTNSRKHTIWPSSSLLAFVPKPLGVSTVMMTGSWVLLDALGMADAYHEHWAPWLAGNFQEEMDVESWVDHPWAMLSSIMPTQWSSHNNPKDKPGSTLGCGCWALGSAGGSMTKECIEEHR